jgi:hypothetical protein
MSTRPVDKLAAPSKDKAAAARHGGEEPAALLLRRPAAPASSSAAPPAVPPADLVPIDEGSEIVDIDARPAGEAHAGHRTFAGYALPKNAADIVPPSTPTDTPTRRPLPIPKPREASSDLSVDERLDLLTELPTSSSSSAATQMPPASRAPAGAATPALPTPRAPRASAPGQAPPAGLGATFKTSPAPRIPTPPDKTVRVADVAGAPPAAASAAGRVDPVVLEGSSAGTLASASPPIAPEPDVFSSLSFDADDAAARPPFPARDRPTGLLTSGVASSTPDSVPPSHVTEPPEYPTVPERPAEIESPPTPLPFDGEGPVAQPTESAAGAGSAFDFEPAILAEAVFSGDSPNPVADKPESSPAVEGRLDEPDGHRTARATAPSSQKVTMPRPEPLSPEMVLLGGSIVSWLLGAFTFGVPSFVVAAFATVFLARRQTRRPNVMIAAILALLGGLIGISVSMAWWLGRPIYPFPWKPW